jgi:hypothetical protein
MDSSNRRRRSHLRVLQMKCFLLLYICSVCLHCSCRSSPRPYKTRRRNNTGFYYGIRDDDMGFGDNCGVSVIPPRFMPVKTSHRDDESRQEEIIAKLEYLTRHFSSDCSDEHTLPASETVYQNASPQQCKTTLGINRVKLMQSLSQSVIQSLLMPVHHHQLGQYQMGEAAAQSRRRSHGAHSVLNKSVLPKMNHNAPMTSIINTASLVKSKPKPSNKKRRKNNTGFYYGIREDVLVLPENSSNEGERNRKSTGVLGSIGKQMIDRSANLIEKPTGNNHAGVGLKQPHIGQDDITKEKKSSVQQLEVPPIKEKVSPKIKLEQPKTQYKPSQSQRDEQKKNKKNRGKKEKHVKSPSLDQLTSELIDETLQELREMKDEIVALREELRSLKGEMREGEGLSSIELMLPDGSMADTDKSRWWGRPPSKQIETSPENEDSVPLLQLEQVIEEEREGPTSTPDVLKVSPRARRREFEQIGKDVESWACSLLFDEEKVGNGWKEISCNNFMKKKLNPDGRTQVYLKVSSSNLWHESYGILYLCHRRESACSHQQNIYFL